MVKVSPRGLGQPVDLMQTLRRAVAALERGNLGEADLLCKLVLARDKKQFAALHILGLTALARGQLIEAHRLISQALKANPRSADAHCNLARVLSELGRPEQALASCDRALAIDPNHILALNSRGSVLWRLKRPAEALASLDRALALKPDYVDALCNRGNVLIDLQRFEEAVESYDRALAIDPNDVLTLVNRGNALFALQRRDEAIASYDRALALQPDDVPALKDRGVALLYLGRPADALACFERVLALRPDDASAHNSRGKALHDLGRLPEALTSFDRALAIEPDYVTALLNRGTVQAESTDYERALASFHRVLALDPGNAEAHFGIGCILLRQGELHDGWEEYDWRLKISEMASPWRNPGKPRWRGTEDISGKTVLIHCEQGYGDTIHFSRYVERVAAKGARVILVVQPALKSLFAASLKGCDRVLGVGEELPEFDFASSIMGLPLAFGTTLDTIPAPVPYLYASPERTAAWAARLGPKDRLRVGLVWSGNPKQPNDRTRSIPLQQFLPLLLPQCQFVSLQKDVRDHDREFLRAHSEILHFGDELADFSDTAALASHMDVVISVCTSSGHLAAAMNKPTWFLLSNYACWRWLLQREDSPWYPSARLFRQTAPGDWKSVMEKAAGELAKLA